VLRYVGGTSPHVDGAHPEPVAALQAIAGGCDTALAAEALHGLLALQVDVRDDVTLVPRSATGPGAPDGGRAWLLALTSSVRDVATDPFVRDALGRITLDEGDGGDTGGSPGDDGVRVGRRAFQLLAHLMLADAAAPAFDAATVRGLAESALFPQIDDAEALAKIQHLLDVLFVPLDPSFGHFGALQETLGCFDRRDDAQAIAGMLYDWLTIEALSVEIFVDDLVVAGSAREAEALRVVLEGVSAGLAARPSLAADLGRVGANGLRADTAAALVAALLEVQGRGVVAELLAFVQGLGTCTP
jgi:hypothetical protein